MMELTRQIEISSPAVSFYCRRRTSETRPEKQSDKQKPCLCGEEDNWCKIIQKTQPVTFKSMWMDGYNFTAEYFQVLVGVTGECHAAECWITI